MDEWGPYDGRSPKLWPTDTTRLDVPLRVLGPPGEWRVVERRNVARVSAETGTIEDTLTVTPAAGEWHDWSVTLEYEGSATVSPRGVESRAGRPVRFTFERFEPFTDWQVRFFTWTDSTRDPTRDAAAFENLLAAVPALTRNEHRLDYQWFRPGIAALPPARWALEAVATLDLPAGEVYSLRTISDDAVRVWVDGTLVIDHWEPHGSLVDYAAIAPGRHDVRIRYYQLDGWTEIRVDVVKGRARSPGSPGPH